MSWTTVFRRTLTFPFILCFVISQGACGKEQPQASTAPTAPPQKQTAPPPPPDWTPPVSVDYEESAEAEITPANYKATLESMESELQD